MTNKSASVHSTKQSFEGLRHNLGISVRLVFTAAAAGMTFLALSASPARSETATIYGNTASFLSANAGAFLPANSGLVCLSVKDSNCWDGKQWYRLYPAGRRHYARPTSEKVACAVIVTPGNDCWTGSAWYQLPKGQIFGVIGGFLSNAPGAFITAPLQPPSKTYISKRPPSPLGEYASR